MSFDMAGKWGLRFRLQLAVESGWSYATAAEFLDIPESELRNYLTQPEYVLSATDYQSILTNLASLSDNRPHYDKTTLPNGNVIYYVESALWTGEQLDNLVVPGNSTTFKVHYLAPSAQHRPASTRLYSLDTYDPAEIAIDVTEGELDRLISIIFYEYRPFQG